MTTLKETLQTDVVKHLKAKQPIELMVVRAMVAAIEVKEKGGKTPVVLSDIEAISTLTKEAAKRRDTANIYDGAGAFERAAKEIYEAEVIEGYLPAGLTIDEVTIIVSEVITRTGATGMKDMRLVMPEVTAAIQGRYDGSAVAALVKAKLA